MKVVSCDQKNHGCDVDNPVLHFGFIWHISCMSQPNMFSHFFSPLPVLAQEQSWWSLGYVPCPWMGTAKKCCSKNSCATCFVTWFESTPTQENKWAHLTQGLKLIWVHPQSISNCQKWSLENSKGCGFGRNPPSKSARLPYEVFLHLNRESNWIESPAWSLGLQKQLQELMVQVMPFWHQREAF